jgi:hypothetical protein
LAVVLASVTGSVGGASDSGRKGEADDRSVLGRRPSSPVELPPSRMDS